MSILQKGLLILWPSSWWGKEKEPNVDISSFLWYLLNLWNLMECVDNQKTMKFILPHFKICQIPRGSRGLGLLPNIFIVVFTHGKSVIGFYWEMNNFIAVFFPNIPVDLI